MAFVRGKRRGKRVYYYLVENVNEGGRTRQVIIKYYGTRRPRGRQKGLKGQ